jgi:hypothetical protein
VTAGGSPLGTTLFGVWLALSLALHAAAHLALVVGLSRQKPAWRGAVAFVLPPLAPYWGWSSGMRAPASVWLAALGAFALGVALNQTS